MGLIPTTADHNPELQVYWSLDHMYSCKISFCELFVIVCFSKWSLWLYFCGAVVLYGYGAWRCIAARCTVVGCTAARCNVARSIAALYKMYCCTLYYCTLYWCALNCCTLYSCTLYSCTLFCTLYSCTLYSYTLHSCTLCCCTMYCWRCSTARCTAARSATRCTAARCTAARCRATLCAVRCIAARAVLQHHRTWGSIRAATPRCVHTPPSPHLSTPTITSTPAPSNPHPHHSPTCVICVLCTYTINITNMYTTDILLSRNENDWTYPILINWSPNMEYHIKCIFNTYIQYVINDLGTWRNVAIINILSTMTLRVSVVELYELLLLDYSVYIKSQHYRALWTVAARLLCLH